MRDDFIAFALVAIVMGGALFGAAWNATQHGPDVHCKQWCAPKGHEGDVSPPDGVPVVSCARSTGDESSCAAQGEQCGHEHRSGCTEFCRTQCCSCCSI